MIEIVVVDDHPVVRAGIVGLLETEIGFQVVGEAESGEAALALLAHRETHVDVVLMDLRMPGMGGVAATRQIVERDDSENSGAGSPRVLVFTTYETDDLILEAIEAGASGYLLKAAPAAELIAGVRAVAAGQTVLAPSIAAQLARAAQATRENPGVPVPQLTAREREVLSLVAEGLSNAAIAAQLYIGESTVKTHLVHVFEKLGVGDRTLAVMRAMELGLLSS